LRAKVKRPTAAVLAVGDELLSGRQDTNGPALEARLAAFGLEPRERRVLPDELELAARGVRALLAAHDIVVTCGGLGPTQDDVTREAVARALGLELVFVPSAWRSIQGRFRRMRRELPESNRAQAFVPSGAVVLPNAWGTAPGFLVQADGRWVASLPGPPQECLPMFDQELLPRLQRAFRLKGRTLHRRVLRTCGAAESGLQDALGPIFREPGLPELGFLLDEPGEILVILTVREPEPEKARAVLRRGYALARKQLGEDYVGDGALSLPASLGQQLGDRKQTLAVAESCTGGLISRRITSVPGSSAYFLEGAITYTNAAKIRRLGVSPALLARYGAVSEPVATAMAAGMRQQSSADWALAVTGIAGPGGAGPGKPVGTVCFGLAGPGGLRQARTCFFLGDRDLVQRRSATTALDWLRRFLAKGSGSESRK